MKNEEVPIINIMTSRLPRELSRPIYSEFQSRYSEAVRVIEGYDKYRLLQKDLDLVELLLAMSIFHNRVLTNLDAATKFYGLVIKSGKAEGIKIGRYVLNQDEINVIQGILINNRKILRKYNMDDSLFNYQLTIDFLQKLINLKTILDGQARA
jgi:hypothetical protein